MKEFIVKLFKRVAEAALPVESRQNSQLTQRSLYFHYQDMVTHSRQLPSFRDAGFRVYSQSDEDGILLYIFSLIGFESRLLLDVASGAPVGGNSTNLILNWGFNALLLEGDDKLVDESKLFYRRHADSMLFPPRIRQAWITAENINQLISQEGFSGEIDLLSLDVDGVDYWLWKSLDVVSPRVVMVEYQDMFFSNESYTVPYSPDFNRFNLHPEFFGASLAAFVKLANDKGYRLVGCNRYGYNAFFVRNDLANDILPETTIDSCLVHPKILGERTAKRDAVINLPWEIV